MPPDISSAHVPAKSTDELDIGARVSDHRVNLPTDDERSTIDSTSSPEEAKRAPWKAGV
jgi:hypothetical protein